MFKLSTIRVDSSYSEGATVPDTMFFTVVANHKCTTAYITRENLKRYILIYRNQGPEYLNKSLQDELTTNPSTTLMVVAGLVFLNVNLEDDVSHINEALTDINHVSFPDDGGVFEQAKCNIYGDVKNGNS